MKKHENFVRTRIAELRLARNVSEHKMSLDLGKSGAYMRSISSGLALPSLKELFNIISYFDITPVEFFAPFEPQSSTYHKICYQLLEYNEDELNKILRFLDIFK